MFLLDCIEHVHSGRAMKEKIQLILNEIRCCFLDHIIMSERCKFNVFDI